MDPCWNLIGDDFASDDSRLVLIQKTSRTTKRKYFSNLEQLGAMAASSASQPSSGIHIVDHDGSMG
jgi:hypothetical protein